MSIPNFLNTLVISTDAQGSRKCFSICGKRNSQASGERCISNVSVSMCCDDVVEKSINKFSSGVCPFKSDWRTFRKVYKLIFKFAYFSKVSCLFCIDSIKLWTGEFQSNRTCPLLKFRRTLYGGRLGRGTVEIAS